MTKKSQISHDANASEVCDALDLSRSTLRRYIEQGMPYVGESRKRRFNLGECVKWIQDQGKTGTPGRPAEPAGDELQRVRIAKEKLLCKKYELEVAKVEGRLMDIADVIEKYKRLAVEVRRHMQQLPPRILIALDTLTHEEKNSADKQICEMCDDVINMVGDAMAEYTTPFANLVLSKKPLLTEH